MNYVLVNLGSNDIRALPSGRSIQTITGPRRMRRTIRLHARLLPRRRHAYAPTAIGWKLMKPFIVIDTELIRESGCFVHVSNYGPTTTTWDDIEKWNDHIVAANAWRKIIDL